MPYRNHKLTQLMSDSLGGNAKTLMFVNLSPTAWNAQETLSSLVYATRAKQVTNKASRQEESEEIARLKQVISGKGHGVSLAFVVVWSWFGSLASWPKVVYPKASQGDLGPS